MNENMEMTGFFYMTSVMRSNFERFGDLLCLDAMQKRTNTHFWPYIALVVLNDLHKPTVVYE